MKKFIIPDKWCVLARNTEEDIVLTDYIRDELGDDCNYDQDCKGNCWFSNQQINGDHYYSFYKPQLTVITFEQFEKYILNGEIDEEIVKYNPNDPELQAIYKRLFNL